MKWMLGTYTQRWNPPLATVGAPSSARRYKAQSIDERTPGILRSACDYVHLNPDRCAPAGRRGLVGHLSVDAATRPTCGRGCGLVWLRTDRLLGEHGKAATRR